ncbi:hypothetical protein Tco_0739773, partial [Tanacetum coccineum]
MLTKPQFFYDHTTKQALGFQNPFYLKKAQQLVPKLYDDNVIKNTSAIVIPDSEETLMLDEESRSKMLLKQNDPMMDEIIPFVKALKDIFNTFDQYLIDELSEVQNVFHQMEQAVEQHLEQARSLNPLDNALAYACMYTKQIQELLVYVSDTCPVLRINRREVGCRYSNEQSIGSTLFARIVLTARGWNSRSPRLVLCGNLVSEMQQVTP